MVSTGGKYVYDDDQETPNTQIATFDYGDCELCFEVRGLMTGSESDLSLRGGNFIGNLFYGAKATWYGGRRVQDLSRRQARAGRSDGHGGSQGR